MCFSATASFAASGAIGTVGVLTLKKVKTRAELPLASIPLLFAFQQLIEGVIWISFGKAILLSVMTYIYSFFSHVLWPVFIPWSIMLVEPGKKKRTLLKALVYLGILVALFDFYYIVKYPVSVQITNASIDYIYIHIYPKFILIFYVATVSFSGMLSSHRIIKWLGIATALSLLMAIFFYQATFISAWCFFAALLSVIVYWFFLEKRKSH